MAAVKCGHPGCCCLPSQGLSFCSTHCETIEHDKVDDETGCACGHAGCDPNGKRGPLDLEPIIPDSRH